MISNKILVTGGAGYIGSHACAMLEGQCGELVILDNLYSGHKWAVPKNAHFYEGDIRDQVLLDRILTHHEIDTVLHFAGHIEVNESVNNPGKYYDNNVVGSLNLIQCCISHNVNQFIFSSSAAVYGAPIEEFVNESTLTSPINPYGQSKLMTEWTLRDFAIAYASFRFVALRYFNVAGAAMAGNIGQATPNATHLIKVACETACGVRDEMKIFGSDYDTRDGTCIRDYIHVDDLAQAHIDAIAYLNNGGESLVANCGYGRGFSVKEVIDTLKRQTGIDFNVVETDRRAGDPPQLISDNTFIKSTLNWIPRYDDLALICESAYTWERSNQFNPKYQVS